MSLTAQVHGGFLTDFGFDLLAQAHDGFLATVQEQIREFKRGWSMSPIKTINRHKDDDDVLMFVIL